MATTTHHSTSSSGYSPGACANGCAGYGTQCSCPPLIVLAVATQTSSPLAARLAAPAVCMEGALLRRSGAAR